MATKAKKKVHSMPKLGWKDMALYWTVMGSFWLFAIVGFFIPLFTSEKIAFADTSVLAGASGPGNDRSLWLPLLSCVPGLIICGPYQRRIPIFGRSDIKYGPPAYPRIYPVFMKNKPQYWVSQKEVTRKKRTRLIVAALLIVAFAICIPLYVSSFYGRTLLHKDGSISVYDGSNELAENYYAGEITSVELTTYSTSSRTNVFWYISFNIYMENGEKFSFHMGDFPGTPVQELEGMLYAKENLFGDRLWITGAENLNKVIADRYATTQEQQLVYKLFDMTS